MVLKSCECDNKPRMTGWTHDPEVNRWVCPLCRKPSHQSLWGPYPMRAPDTGRQYRAEEGNVLPYRLHSYICQCPKDYTKPGSYAVRWNHDRHIVLCYHCNKMLASNVFECEVDGKIFVKDFKHLAFCNHHPQCWEHLDQDLETPICGDRPHDWQWSEDCPMPPWTNLNAPPPDISDFDPFAPLSF